MYHFRTGWQVVKRFSLTGAIENVTDEDYRIHGSILNEAGCNFILSADWRFFRAAFTSTPPRGSGAAARRRRRR